MNKQQKDTSPRNIDDISQPHFSAQEADILLQVKGVGLTVIKRLEQMGIVSLAQLACADITWILSEGVYLTGSTCWQNSPQAKAAIGAAITKAQQVTSVSAKL